MTDKDITDLLRQACEIYKAASLQSHSGHWDRTGRGGAGCPECIRARDLREEADKIMRLVAESKS